MACLEDFEEMKQRLRSAKKCQVEALHKFVFEANGDRNNRKRLREFRGFTFDKNDALYAEKSKYIAENLTEADLISICILLGLDFNVTNLQLHIFENLSQNTLLKDAQKDDDDDQDNNDDEEDELESDSQIRAITARLDDEDDAVSMSSVNHQQHLYDERRNQVRSKFSLNFKDVEDSVRCFDGSGNIDVNDWVHEFEEFAVLMGWDQVQKMIFGKKSMRGLAKLFVQGEQGLTTWVKLRNALIDEFSTKLNSAQVHKMLVERRMKTNESVQEYLYKMKEIAARGDIEDVSLIQYVIDGIHDSQANKLILYGARTIKQFKEKLRIYEMVAKKPTAQSTCPKMKQNNSEMTQTTDKKTPTSKKENGKNGIRCYNCGKGGHISSDCPNKQNGKKCFQCNMYGHIAKDCEAKTAKNTPRNVQMLTTNDDDMIKIVKILNQQWYALLDTGSKLHVMKLRVYRSLGDVKLQKSNIMLRGFGTQHNTTRPIGKIKIDVEIEGDTYNLELHVVPDDQMDVDIVIGRSIFQQAEGIINPDGLNIKKLEVHMMMNINTDENCDDIVDIEKTASTSAKEIVRELVKNYEPNCSKTTNVSMKIILTDETPIASRPRRLPLTERKIVEEQINEWLEQVIIENSESEFSSPILLVSKKDGGKRLCVDYRRINKVIVKDRFPLPLIEDQLDRLQDAKYFCTLDLKNGFFHVPVDKESRKYTAFVSHNGQYQFNKVPFGLSNSPAVFQRHVNSIFRQLTQRGIALPYVDDIIIPAETEEQAIEYLKEVVQTCKDYGLKINLKKCHFLKTEIEFLGHMIQYQQISPAPAKVKAMLKYPVPTNMKEVESFLGLAGYFRKFIPNFSQIAKPLSDLKKKNTRFKMQEEEIIAFNTLKCILSEKPVLKIFNEKHNTELHTDASADGYGAVLLQKLPDDGLFHPVYYMSRKTTEAERKYTSYELEILAVIEALKKFRIYLLGIQFKIITDCNAFAKTMEKRDLSTRVSRWILLLQEYDYTIEHRSGSQMRHVDAFSRYPIMTIGEESLMTKLKRSQLQDERLKPIIEILQQNSTYEDYFLKAGVLYKLVNDCEKIVIPDNMQYEIIKNAHEKGHFALNKTKSLLSNEYYMNKMDEKILNCIAGCIPCLLSNKKRGKQEGELHPITKPDIPLHTYHVDHLGPLESTSKNYKHIFAVIDAFTKFTWLYPTKTTTSNEVIMKLRNQSNVFGNPAVIVSDRGSAFTSELFTEYCKNEGIIHHKITTGLPRANGQIERLNSVIISVLTKLSIEDPSKWYRHVEKVQQYINSSFQRSIKTTPFEVLIGSKMRTKEDIELKQLIEAEMISSFQDNRDEMRNEAKQQIVKIQNENRHTYNLRRKAVTPYKVGDVIAIKRTQFGSGLKLKSKYLGPYRIDKVKPNNTYDVTKIGEGEGPHHTSTCAEYVKPWPGFETKP